MSAPTSSSVTMNLGGQKVTITREFEGDSTAFLRALDTVQEIAVDFRLAERTKRRLLRISDWASQRRRREALRRLADYELLPGNVVRHIGTGDEFALDGTGWCTCSDSQLHCKPLWRAMDKLLCGTPPRCLHSEIRGFERTWAASCPVHADAGDFAPKGTRPRDTGFDLTFRSRKELLSYLKGLSQC